MDALLPLTSVCRLSSERAVASLSLTITSSIRSRSSRCCRRPMQIGFYGAATCASPFWIMAMAEFFTPPVMPSMDTLMLSIRWPRAVSSVATVCSSWLSEDETSLIALESSLKLVCTFQCSGRFWRILRLQLQCLSLACLIFAPTMPAIFHCCRRHSQPILQ